MSTISFTGVVRAVKIEGLDNGGAAPGYDLVAVRAINRTPAIDNGYIITLSDAEILELISAPTPVETTPCAASHVTRYAYDGGGNVVEQIDRNGRRCTYEYDHENRMTKVTQYSKSPGEGGVILHEESYRYDALGRRIQVVSDGEETINVYDGKSFMANEWTRFNAGGELVQRFLFTEYADQLIARWHVSDGLEWTLRDHLGTIRDMIADTKQFTQHIQYTAFGIPKFSYPEGASHPHAFTGRIWDSLSGLSFHRARYTNAQVGRWMSMDPVGFEAGDLNLFRCVGNDPVYSLDPSGLMLLEYQVKVIDFLYTLRSTYPLAGAIICIFIKVAVHLDYWRNGILVPAWCPSC